MDAVTRTYRGLGFWWVRFFVAGMLAICLASAAMPARADMPVGEFRKLLDGVAARDDAALKSLSYYMLGLLDGLAEINAAYVEAGARPLVCVPDNPHPPLFDVVTAIDDELELQRSRWANNPRFSVEPIAILALKRKWPCRR